MLSSENVADELVMWEEFRPNVMLTNNDEFVGDTTLRLNLVFRWPYSETYDD